MLTVRGRAVKNGEFTLFTFVFDKSFTSLVPKVFDSPPLVGLEGIRVT
jgi:hypothetical protein